MPGFQDVIRHLKSRHQFSFNSVVGLIGSTGILLIGLAQVALLTKLLPLDQFGYYVIVVNFVQITATVIHLRLREVYYNFASHQKGVPTSAWKQLLRMAILSGLIYAMASIPIGIFCAFHIYEVKELAIAMVSLLLIEAFAAYHYLNTGRLRLANHFTFAVGAQVLGSGLSLALIAGSALGSSPLTLGFAITATALGRLLEFAITTICALRLCPVGNNASEQTEMEGALHSQVLHFKVADLLKIGSERGGLLFLGLIAGASQSALFGFALQLLRPLKVIQDVVMAALAPEIARHFHNGEHGILRRLISRYVWVASSAGLFSILIAILLLDPLIRLIATEDYLSVKPTLILLLIAQVITLSALPYTALSNAMGRIRERNRVVALRLPCIFLAMLTGLHSISLATAHLIGVVIVRVFYDLPFSRFYSRQFKTEDPNLKHT